MQGTRNSKLVLAIGMTLAVMVSPMAFANEITVVLDATEHGSPSFDFPPLLVPVTAGTYECTIVDSMDGQPSAKAWSFAFGNPGTWRTTYECRRQDGTVYTGGEATEADSADEAFIQTTAKTIIIEVPVDQDLRFNVQDNKVIDNHGGVTLRLCKMTPTATETSSWGNVKDLFR